MDRKNDDSRLLLEQVNDLLENNKILELRELLEEYHTMDILDVMENLDEEMKVKGRVADVNEIKELLK